MSAIPKVLLIGDSIRMGYQPHVARLLEGKTTVVGPAENCQHSLYILSSLDRWVRELGRPDIIHWNNGLHDSGHNPGRTPAQIPIDMYRVNMASILPRLRALTPHVIWATITPVHPNRPFRDTDWAWRNEEIDQYNNSALELMRGNGVPINDLRKLIWDNMEDFLGEDQLHLSEAGQKACAQAVARAVCAHLPEN